MVNSSMPFSFYRPCNTLKIFKRVWTIQMSKSITRNAVKSMFFPFKPHSFLEDCSWINFLQKFFILEGGGVLGVINEGNSVLTWASNLVWGLTSWQLTDDLLRLRYCCISSFDYVMEINCDVMPINERSDLA